jgi:hypothetical protein
MNKNNPPHTLPDSFPPDAETINAIVDGLGALVICLAKQMPPKAKAELASDLARLSASSTASGRPIVGRLIGDLSRAAAQ